MTENLRYVRIPDFDPEKTLVDLYSNDKSTRIYALFSLTYYSGDSLLILKTLNNVIKGTDVDLKLIAYQCLSRYIEIYRDVPVDTFISYIVMGFANEQLHDHSVDILENLFYYIVPTWLLTDSQIVTSFKSADITAIIMALMFVNHSKWETEKLSAIIRKSLRHNSEIVKCCGGILLRLEYINLHKKLNEFEFTAKLSARTPAASLRYFNHEIVEIVDWIEEDLRKLKGKLSKSQKSA